MANLRQHDRPRQSKSDFAKSNRAQTMRNLESKRQVKPKNSPEDAALVAQKEAARQELVKMRADSLRQELKLRKQLLLEERERLREAGLLGFPLPTKFRLTYGSRRVVVLPVREDRHGCAFAGGVRSFPEPQSKEETLQLQAQIQNYKLHGPLVLRSNR